LSLAPKEIVVGNEEQLVASAYRLLLGRKPEPAGLRHWSQMLRAGMSREEFLLAMIGGTEFRARVGAAEGFDRYADIDLIIPLRGRRLRVPAVDRSLVPHLIAHREWEPHLTRYLESSLDPDSVFADVGANFGYHTIMCAPLAKSVIAFEPVDAAFRYCEMNVALNGLHNVQLFPYGLWSEDKVIGIAVDKSQLMGSHLRESGPADATARCVALDSLIEKGEVQLSRLDVVKMDVEGAEVAALQGMCRSLARFRPRLLLEANRPTLASFGLDLADLWHVLRGSSYSLEAFVPWGDGPRQSIRDLAEFERHCPADGLVDVLAVPD
jgi:FkbM family methyltransferase